MSVQVGSQKIITIVDYGAGNLGAVANILSRLGADVIVTSDLAKVSQAEKLLLPGVGAFDHGMSMLKSSGLVNTLKERVLEKRVPMLGICLGMQLFFERSDEGLESGLGWIPGEVKQFELPQESKLRVPHMGWNELNIIRKNSMLLHSIPEDLRFYFAHSYHVVCSDQNDRAATSIYGYEFDAIVQRGNIYGTQFHPEKSHKFGMWILQNYLGVN